MFLLRIWALSFSRDGGGGFVYRRVNSIKAYEFRSKLMKFYNCKTILVALSSIHIYIFTTVYDYDGSLFCDVIGYD